MSSVFVFLVSIAAGLVGAVSGMGGGVVLIPILTAAGIDIKRAIALSILSVIAVSNGAASHYVRRHIPNLKVGAFFEVFAVIGSLVGASLTVVSGQRTLFLLCGSLLIGSCATFWRRRNDPWRSAVPQDALSRQLALEGSYYDEAEQRTIAYRGGRTSLSGLLMFGAGLVSGWLGIGGSALTVLVHAVVMGLPPKVSVTMSNLIIGVMALAGASVYLEAGLINSALAVPVILGVPLGALVGSKLLVGATNRIVRIVCLSVLLVLGMEMLTHGIRGV